MTSRSPLPPQSPTLGFAAQPTAVAPVSPPTPHSEQPKTSAEIAMQAAVQSLGLSLSSSVFQRDPLPPFTRTIASTTSPSKKTSTPAATPASTAASPAQITSPLVKNPIQKRIDYTTVQDQEDLTAQLESDLLHASTKSRSSKSAEPLSVEKTPSASADRSPQVTQLPIVQDMEASITTASTAFKTAISAATSTVPASKSQRASRVQIALPASSVDQERKGRLSAILPPASLDGAGTPSSALVESKSDLEKVPRTTIVRPAKDSRDMKYHQFLKTTAEKTAQEAKKPRVVSSKRKPVRTISEVLFQYASIAGDAEEFKALPPPFKALPPPRQPPLPRLWGHDPSILRYGSIVTVRSELFGNTLLAPSSLENALSGYTADGRPVFDGDPVVTVLSPYALSGPGTGVPRELFVVVHPTERRTAFGQGVRTGDVVAFKNISSGGFLMAPWSQSLWKEDEVAVWPLPQSATSEARRLCIGPGIPDSTRTPSATVPPSATTRPACGTSQCWTIVQPDSLFSALQIVTTGASESLPRPYITSSQRIVLLSHVGAEHTLDTLPNRDTLTVHEAVELAARTAASQLYCLQAAAAPQHMIREYQQNHPLHGKVSGEREAPVSLYVDKLMSVVLAQSIRTATKDSLALETEGAGSALWGGVSTGAQGLTQSGLAHTLAIAPPPAALWSLHLMTSVTNRTFPLLKEPSLCRPVLSTTHLLPNCLLPKSYARVGGVLSAMHAPKRSIFFTERQRIKLMSSFIPTAGEHALALPGAGQFQVPEWLLVEALLDVFSGNPSALVRSTIQGVSEEIEMDMGEDMKPFVIAAAAAAKSAMAYGNKYEPISNVAPVVAQHFGTKDNRTPVQLSSDNIDAAATGSLAYTQLKSLEFHLSKEMKVILSQHSNTLSLDGSRKRVSSMYSHTGSAIIPLYSGPDAPKVSISKDPEPGLTRVQLVYDAQTVELTNRLLPIAKQYIMCCAAIQRYSHPTMGTTAQALAAAASTVLKEFRALLLQIGDRNRLHAAGRNNGKEPMERVSLSALSFLLMPSANTLASLASILWDPPPSARGGELLLYLCNWAKNCVDAAPRALSAFLIEKASTPMLRWLEGWIYKGVCHDPFDEFFIVEDQRGENRSEVESKNEGYERSLVKHSALAEDPDVTLQTNQQRIEYASGLDTSERGTWYWQYRFQLRESHIPPFLQPYAHTILNTGKTLHIVRLTRQHFLSRKVQMSSEPSQALQLRSTSHLYNFHAIARPLQTAAKSSTASSATSEVPDSTFATSQLVHGSVLDTVINARREAMLLAPASAAGLLHPTDNSAQTEMLPAGGAASLHKNLFAKASITDRYGMVTTGAYGSTVPAIQEEEPMSPQGKQIQNALVNIDEPLTLSLASGEPIPLSLQVSRYTHLFETSAARASGELLAYLVCDNHYNSSRQTSFQTWEQSLRQLQAKNGMQQGVPVTPLQQLISSGESWAAKGLLGPGADLIGHIRTIKAFFLCGQSDWISNFLESAEMELMKPTPPSHAQPGDQVYVSLPKLRRLFEMSIRNSLAGSDPNRKIFQPILASSSLLYHLEALASFGKTPLPVPDALPVASSRPLAGYQHFNLECTVSWPLTQIFTPPAMARYGLIFRHLFSIRHAETVIASAWTAYQATKSLPGVRGVLVPTLGLLHKMLTFTRAIGYHAFVEGVEPAWEEFSVSIFSATSLSQIIQRQAEFFQTALSSCLLTHTPVLKLLTKLLTLGLLFSQQARRAIAEHSLTAVQLDKETGINRAGWRDMGIVHMQSEDEEKPTEASEKRRRELRARIQADAIISGLAKPEWQSVVLKSASLFETFYRDFLFALVDRINSLRNQHSPANSATVQDKKVGQRHWVGGDIKHHIVQLQYLLQKLDYDNITSGMDVNV